MKAMINNVDIETELAETRQAVAQLGSWCIVVALHQSKGVGRDRLEKLADHILQTQKEYNRRMVMVGGRKALEELQRSVAGYCNPEISLPLNRAPRTGRERQHVAAGNRAFSMVWCQYARAAHEVLGFGSKRLEDVRQETMSNYRQFGDWDNAGKDREWALSRLSRCVEDALQERVKIIEDPEPMKSKAARVQLTAEDAEMILLEGVRRRQSKGPALSLLSEQEQHRRAQKIKEQMEMITRSTGPRRGM